MPRRDPNPYAGFLLALIASLAIGCTPPPETQSPTERLEQSAINGDTEAQYLLGQSYCCGLEEGKNDEKAVTWWCQAARDGHTQAQFELGRLYQMGDLTLAAETRYRSVPVKKDNVVALAWYAVAARNGHTLAKKYEALLYRNLNSVEKQQAYEMLRDPRSIPCRYRGQTL